jgi:sugar O-acyltransferase (sialic acid O-acetyltransferase NeuD family)
MEKKVIIIGAGGFAREVLDIFEACNQEKLTYDVLGYIVEARFGAAGTLVNEKPILGDFDWLAEHGDDVFVICGVGAPHHRMRLIQKAMEFDCRFCNIIHPSVITTRWVEMGVGNVIGAGSILTNQIRIGDHTHINLDSTIGHDAVLEDFVTLAPGVHISGNVSLFEGCYVGTGANILEKIHVGSWSTVGAGTTVVRDVPPNTTVVGVPGRVIKKRESGWHLQHEK